MSACCRRLLPLLKYGPCEMPFDSELFLLANCLPPASSGLLDDQQAVLCVVTRVSECNVCILGICTRYFKFAWILLSFDLQPVAPF